MQDGGLLAVNQHLTLQSNRVGALGDRLADVVNRAASRVCLEPVLQDAGAHPRANGQSGQLVALPRHGLKAAEFLRTQASFRVVLAGQGQEPLGQYVVVVAAHSFAADFEIEAAQYGIFARLA